MSTKEIQGRRREDHPFETLPNDLKHGDYWKLAGVTPNDPGNLTKTGWRFYFEGYGVSTMLRHTVREHDDGTISVLPNDGSSNSIMIYGSHGKSWHGYVYNGVFREL